MLYFMDSSKTFQLLCKLLDCKLRRLECVFWWLFYSFTCILYCVTEFPFFCMLLTTGM